MRKALSFFGWPLLLLPTLVLWIGAAMNEACIHANQAHMPVYMANCADSATMAQDDNVHSCMTKQSRLKIFGDILVSDESVASIGDELQDFGDGTLKYTCWLLWASMAFGCVIRKSSFHL